MELVLDDNTTVADQATATKHPGIFELQVADGVTRNILLLSQDLPASKLNYRPNVVNLVYVKSFRGSYGSTVGGMATDRPANGAGGYFSDDGIPTTSWVKPSGVLPDATAGPRRMKLIPPKQRTDPVGLVAMLVSDGNGDPSAPKDQVEYAHTVAHELGHVLGLRHRIGAGDDEILHPPKQNIMHGSAPGIVSQDLDIIQAKAVRKSPVVPP